MKRIAYFTADEHRVYAWRRGRLTLDAKFPSDDTGASAFREYLGGHRGALFSVVVDQAGEDFHEELIPYLRGSDREQVLRRRLAQRYRDTRLATALSLGQVSGERRNERLLLTSFTNTQRIAPWLDALAESEAKLAGMFSVPLLAPALAARLGVRGGRCFVVNANRAGLRQCFIDNGRLRFARLERAADMTPEAFAAFVRSETGRLAQYLSTLRVLPREGPPVHVVVIAPPGRKAVFERTLVSDARLSFVTIDQAEAARRVGIREAPQDMGAEQLYLQLAARRPPREQFARREERRGYFLWQMQRGLVAAGALAFAACALYAGAIWLDIAGIRSETTQVRADSRADQDEYRRKADAFPVTYTTVDNLRATVLEFTKIAQRSGAPEPTLRYLSQVLDQFPQIEIDSLVWQVDRASGGAGAKPPPASAATKSGPGSQVERLEVSGRVPGMARSDYRAITGEVQRFAEALGQSGVYQVERTQLPFDVTSEGTLSGDIGSTSGGEAPRFTIFLARNLP
ncbi:MAG TPA: hypothetical protein VFV84_12505 [Burkholderiales bacterium]|nr:hypothetical protein [Burkholderiales bacterium]